MGELTTADFVLLNMGKRDFLWKDLSQHHQLPIRIVSPGFGHLPPEQAAKYSRTQRLPYYFFLFVLDGDSRHGLDSANFDMGKHDLLFASPHQIRELPAELHGNAYYKLGFDEECLSRLPRPYPFLLNPLDQPKINFSPAAAARLTAIFEILRSLLSAYDTAPELILAHLNSLLTEMNTAYFAAQQQLTDRNLSKFIVFKLFVEDNLTAHLPIGHIARELAISTDRLYQIVKQHSGLSPKAFINNRIILEARRRLHYGERSSVKELAFELGFSDPDYFSRLFKKVTGKTVAAFFQDLS